MENRNVIKGEKTHQYFTPRQSLNILPFWGINFLHCCNHTMSFIVQFYIPIFLCGYYRYFILVVVYCVVQFYLNFLNFLSVIGNLVNFQIFSIVNNVVIKIFNLTSVPNTLMFRINSQTLKFVVKLYEYFKNYNKYDQIVTQRGCTNFYPCNLCLQLFSTLQVAI